MENCSYWGGPGTYSGLVGTENAVQGKGQVQFHL